MITKELPIGYPENAAGAIVYLPGPAPRVRGQVYQALGASDGIVCRPPTSTPWWGGSRSGAAGQCQSRWVIFVCTEAGPAKGHSIPERPFDVRRESIFKRKNLCQTGSCLLDKGFLFSLSSSLASLKRRLLTMSLFPVENNSCQVEIFAINYGTLLCVH